MYSLPPELPKYLVIRIEPVFRSLRRLLTNQGLPKVQMDHLLMDIFDVMHKPSRITGRGMDDAVRYLMEVHRWRGIELEEEDFEDARNSLTVCLFHLRDNLDALNPYVNGLLPYRYKQRQGPQSVILQLAAPRLAR